VRAPRTLSAPGPFRVDHLRDGDPYELSNGHAIYCAPSGRRGSKKNLIGGEVLETDPAVVSAGVDTGFSRGPGHLRAPDIAVGDFDDEPGFASGVPPLAVEFADTEQDEGQLQAKIRELLDGGTKHVWVVRLVGPRRVEVYEPGRSMRVAVPGEDLRAPGILQNAVPVLAMFEREVAHEATLRNLLQRKGFAGLDDVQARARAEGEARGEARGEAKGAARGEIKGAVDAVLAVLAARSLQVSPTQRRAIRATTDLATLQRWLRRAATATSTAQVMAAPRPARPRRS
jgi:Uma2 family endonuclease